MRENLELSISDSASVFSADLTVHCRHVDARKVGACTDNCFSDGITEGDGEEGEEEMVKKEEMSCWL